MKKKSDSLFKTLQYIMFVCVIIFGFITIVGTGGGGGGGGGGDVPYYDPSLDSDNDGIPNYLEVNGYTYDFHTGTYSLWNGDVSLSYFKSDPLQPSTDGDPYSDSMEVSGLLMDRSVVPPGDHPMIPGYPNLIVKLTNYTVTLNATITQTDGTEHQKETTWNTSTEETISVTDESNYDVTGEVNIGFAEFFTGGASVSLSKGGSHAETLTIGTVMSNGGSTMDSTQWSLATCSNPSEAAKIKLTLQAKNVGTCVAKDVYLTMDLWIGGKSVRTIYMENPISTLEVGKTHTWVSADIMLTYDELRSLETGASVAVKIPEDAVIAQVVRKKDDLWVVIGDWDDYMREAREICAHLFLDLGDGNTIEQLIYADDAESAPEVILKDAIIWAANGQDDPALGPVVRFYQADGSLGPAKPLNGWYFSLDAATYDSIPGDKQNPDFNLFNTVLLPDSVIVAKAPPIEDWPKIRWATLSPRHGKVTAYVDDYFFSQDFLEVYFVDKWGNLNKMTWDKDKICFSCACPDDYFKDGTEKIVARNALYDPGKPDTLKWQTEMDASEIGYERSFKNSYLAGSLEIPGTARGVFVLGDYAYVVDDNIINDNGGLSVIKIDINPDGTVTLTENCSLEIPDIARGVYVSGDYAYVAAYAGGLTVFDISNPLAPIHKDTLDITGYAQGVYVSGDYAYVAADYGGLSVIKIDIDPFGTVTLIEKGSCDTPNHGHAHDVFVSGDYAYVAAYTEGLVVYNISNPASPSPIGSCPITGAAANGVFVSGTSAYVASKKSPYVGDVLHPGLQMIDIDKPASPSPIGSYDIPGNALGVFVLGDYAYVAADSEGLWVIDISNPASPSLIGSYKTQGYAQGVYVSGDYAYVADMGFGALGSGLQVIGFR